MKLRLINESPQESQREMLAGRLPPTPNQPKPANPAARFDQDRLVRLKAPYRMASSAGQYRRMVRTNPNNPDSLFAADSNQVRTSDLTQAVKYHQDHMNNERWPELEQAFLARALSFSGGRGNFVRPRTTLFTYLQNIKEQWPEGVKMAIPLMRSVFSHHMNWDQTARLLKSNSFLEFVAKYGTKSMVTAAKRARNQMRRYGSNIGIAHWINQPQSRDFENVD